MAFKFFDAQDSTGTSGSIIFRRPIKDHTVQIEVTGSPTAVTVDLEGSLDDGFWTALGTIPLSAQDITDGGSVTHLLNKPIRFVRANLTELTGGTSPTVTVLYEPFDGLYYGN